MYHKNWDRFVLILTWLVAAIFIFAGVSKMIDPSTFARDIDNYRLLPYLLVTLMAIILPWLEVFCGIFLIIGKLKKGAAFTLLVLTFMFIIAIGSAVARGLDITCGCFSNTIEGTKVGFTRLIEDGILFISIIIIYLKLTKA